MSSLDVDALLGAVYGGSSTSENDKQRKSDNSPKSRDSEVNSSSTETEKSSRNRDGSHDDSRSRKRRYRPRSRSPPYKRRRPKRDATPPELSPESQAEQDARTVFVVGLPTTATERDLKPFFEQAGTVKTISLISDRNSRRSKGIGYIQYEKRSSVPMALNLNGTLFKKHTISIQATMAEKNRVATVPKPTPTSYKVVVSNLDPRLSEDDLVYFFEQVGFAKSVLFADDNSDDDSDEKPRQAVVTYKKPEEAKKAVEFCNGFKLLEFRMRVEHQTGASFLAQGHSAASHLDLEGADDQGIRLDGATRLALMNRLSHRNVDVNLPLSQVASPTLSGVTNASTNATPKSSIPTNFVILKNMFDPSEADEDPEVFDDVKEAVTEECAKFGAVEDIFVDEKSPDGLVYLKLDSIKAAEQTKGLLDGRWYAGKMVSVNFLSADTFNSKRPK